MPQPRTPVAKTPVVGIVSVSPLTSSILVAHVRDGYVIHHKKGEPRSKETVVLTPFDAEKATWPGTYRVSSSDDPAFDVPKLPTKVSRKSKGTAFAWFIDRWENNRAVNTRPDHGKEHWFYIQLPKPMQPGKTYVLETGALVKNGRRWPVRFDLSTARSEAVHVNTLGYVPDAPQKFGYLYHWMGDSGGLFVKGLVGKPFHLIDTVSKKRVFSGKVAFRMPATQVETAQTTDTPGGNYLGADVAECDFSAFSRPGKYVLSIEGVGCSWPFLIGPDVYRPAFLATARALYHNRSGIELARPFTEFVRPAPHHPKLTPGFSGKLRYTKVRSSEWGSEGGDAKKLMAESPGTLENSWGWYQDAGDWDSYESHLRVAQELLLAYQIAPKNFQDRDLNIPESGDGVPDILSEASWLPRFCARLRAELVAKGFGTGGVGLRVAGDAFGSDEGTLPDGTKVGRGSWEDTDRIWMVSGEDPWSTFRYAGCAAQLATFVKKDPGGVDWKREAVESYDWALTNARPGDEEKDGNRLRAHRAYAAASLFALTGDTKYEQQLARDTDWITGTTGLWNEIELYGPAVYALNGRGDAALLTKLRTAILFTADQSLIETPKKRALRWGGNFSFPMLIGQQTTPMVLDGAIGWALTRGGDPARARAYRAALLTTCDYFLGTNSLNQTWITRVGPRYPTEMFHMDAWYNGRGEYHPGLIPYSPWRKEKPLGQGPWDADWPNSTVHPPIDAWPGNERWFSNRCSPLASEFTIHQNVGPSAAIYGILCGGR
jgi:endoglucanase